MQEPRKLPTVTEVCKTLIITGVTRNLRVFHAGSQLLIALTFAAGICKMLLQTVNLKDGIRNLFYYFTREICTFSHIRAKFSSSRNYAKVPIQFSSPHNLTNTYIRHLVREGYLYSIDAVKSKKNRE